MVVLMKYQLQPQLVGVHQLVGVGSWDSSWTRSPPISTVFFESAWGKAYTNCRRLQRL